jgi:predicted ferric reductase
MAPLRTPLLGTGRGVGPSADLVRPAVTVAVVLVVSILLGRLVGTQGRLLVHNKMLPWILGRSLGIATYVALTAMVVLGLWLRHPWRARFRRPGPEAILWGHVTLAACTVALLAGHLTSLALDRYAGVGWTGVFVPWGARLQVTGVAFGTLAFYLLLLVVGTAALAGSIGRAVWFPIHTASVVVFCMTLVHGVLAGSDRVALRWLYVVSGSVVLLLQFTRWLAGTLRHGPAVVDA